MKRFLKVLVILVTSLFLLASGLNATLDRLSHSASQNSFCLYNHQGDAVVTYNGDLRFSKIDLKPVPIAVPSIPLFQHWSDFRKDPRT